MFYAAYVGAVVWAAPLQRSAMREYSFDFRVPLSATMVPLGDVLVGAGVSKDLDISRTTTVAMVFQSLISSVASWSVASCSPLAPPGRARDAEQSEPGSDLVESDIASAYSSDPDECGDSARSTDGESEAPSDGEADDEGVRPPRAEDGTWVVNSNEYFTITNLSEYPASRICIKSRWCKPDLLGTKGMSKTLTIKKYDADEQRPERTYLLLRAWMLWRFQQGRFHEGAPFRLKWLCHETERLREDLLGLGVAAGGTGNVEADKLLHKWCPGLG